MGLLEASSGKVSDATSEGSVIGPSMSGTENAPDELWDEFWLERRVKGVNQVGGR